MRYTSSGGAPLASSACRTSSWGASSTRRIRGRTYDGGCRPCNAFCRARRYRSALHEALGWRYGAAAQLWRSPRLHWRDGTQPALVTPLLAAVRDLGPLPVRRGGAATPQSWTTAPRRWVLVIEGWDSKEEGS